MTAIPEWGATGSLRTDAELACAAAAGDRRAFAGIYDRYADRLHDFCIGMLRDRDSAADCVHDTFCIAATTLGNLRDADKLRPWLYSIARNEALRHIRDRRREQPSDDLPDIASRDTSPASLAHRFALANLIEEAEGGLSDRDRTVLELAYRQNLDGPELAEALGVSQSNAGTMLFRLRDTIERSLGALLVSRQVKANPSQCPELAATLHGWDGKFTILMRKRIARHIESCTTCEEERRKLVNPVALLGGAPLLVPAPGWLREHTMQDVELTCSASDMTSDVAPQADSSQVPTAVSQEVSSPATPSGDDATDDDDGAHDGDKSNRRMMLLIALLVGIPLTVLGFVLMWMAIPETAIAPTSDTLTSTRPTAPAVNPPTGGASPSIPQPPAPTVVQQPFTEPSSAPVPTFAPSAPEPNPTVPQPPPTVTLPEAPPPPSAGPPPFAPPQPPSTVPPPPSTPPPPPPSTETQTPRTTQPPASIPATVDSPPPSAPATAETSVVQPPVQTLDPRATVFTVPPTADSTVPPR
jgi:RNA polymerase sigma factor (sigma-70 family)